MEAPGEGLSKGAFKLCTFRQDLEISVSTMLKIYMILLFPFIIMLDKEALRRLVWLLKDLFENKVLLFLA